MNIVQRLAGAVFGVLGVFNAAVADHPTVVFGSEHGGPLNTISADSLPAGAWAFGARTEVIDFDELSGPELAGLAEAGVEDVHSVGHIVSTWVSVAYGVSDRFDLSLRLPWVWRDNIREGEIEDGEAEAHGHGNTDGLGDLLLLANYQLFAGRGFRAAVQGGVKMPTGATHESDDGERLETEFQPGTGSWDFLVGGAISKTYGRFGFHANVLFDATSEGAQDTELGDALLYNAAVVFSPGAGHDHAGHAHHSMLEEIRWEFTFELNGEQRWRDRESGARERNSGGNVIYASPGIRAALGRFSAFVSFGLPLVDDTNGFQSDVDYRIVGGVALGF